MNKSPTRLDAFLNNYKFFSNNIDFRIKSSKALEKWKNVQSFQLNQLLNGNFYFNPNKREILLLSYDLWSRFLYEIENFCIELGSKHETLIVTEKDVNKILDLIDKTILRYKSVMFNDHKEKFDGKFTMILNQNHTYAEKYLKHMVYNLKGLSYIFMFTNLIDIVTSVMQYLLIEIHELDSFFKVGCDLSLKENMPFIVICDFSKKTKSVLGVNLLHRRIEYYKSHFNFDEIYLKNYTDKFVSKKLLDEIKNMGIDVNLKFSLCN